MRFLSQTTVVRQNIRTRFTVGTCLTMTALNDGTVAVCSWENNQLKLKYFSLATGQQLASTDVDNINDINGMTEVKLGGNSAIAMSS